MISLPNEVIRIINAAEAARLRAEVEIATGSDPRMAAFDLRSAGESLVLAADVLDGKREVRRG